MAAGTSSRLRTAEAGDPPADAPGRAPRPGGRDRLTIPEDALILIPTRNLVLFPGTVLPITLGRQRSIVAAQAAMRLSRPVGLVLQRDPASTTRCRPICTASGTEANLLRYVTSPDGSHHVICQGERRFRIVEFLDGYPFFVARVERIPESEEQNTEIDARLLNLRNQALEVLQLLPQTPAELVNAVQGVDLGPGARRFDRQLYGHHAGRKAGDPGDLSISSAGSTASRKCWRIGSRCCGCRGRSASRPRERSTTGSASSCCASR